MAYYFECYCPSIVVYPLTSLWNSRIIEKDNSRFAEKFQRFRWHNLEASRNWVVNGDLKGSVLVLASGVFDLVHYGHIRFIEEAKKLGGENSRLVVIVARDRTVERLKGRRPIIPEDQRRAVVESLKPVDEAILGYEDLSLEDTVMKVRPDIIAVGYDQHDIERQVKDLVREKELNIRVVRIGKFGQEDLDSSSKIKRKILNEGNLSK